MNTCSKKRQLHHHHPTQQLDDGMMALDTHQHFFTLPNMLDNHTFIHMVQWDTCLYDIQDLEPEEITEQMQIQKQQARRRRMEKIRWEAEIQTEKVRWLKRELWIAHKRSRTDDGVMGIVWWNQEYWGMDREIKRLEVKKEEPSTPSLQIKVKPPPTPPLTYPPSCTSSSQFCSIDPNNFVWSPICICTITLLIYPLHYCSNLGIWHLLV